MAALASQSQPRRVTDSAVKKMIRAKVPVEPMGKLMHICPATALLFELEPYHYRLDVAGVYALLLGFEEAGLKYQILYVDRDHMYAIRMKVSRKHMPFVLQCKIPSVDPAKMTWLQMVDT